MFKGERLSQQGEQDETTKDLTAKSHRYEPGLVTSKKFLERSNAGNALLGGSYEVRMNLVESFRHSRVGEAIVRVIYKAKK